MEKINLFKTNADVIKNFIKKIIYLYHLYTKDKMRSYSQFIHYLNNGWDFDNEFKNNDEEVKKMRDELLDHYEYDLNNDNFKELIKISLYEYIVNYYYYFKNNITVIRSVCLEDYYFNDYIYIFLLDYFSYIKCPISKFILSVYDFKKILCENIAYDNKNEISKSIQNLIINADKNFEFFVNLRTFIDAIEKEIRDVNYSKKEQKKCLDNFFQNDNFFYLTKFILLSKSKDKNIKFFSEIFIKMLNSYAHNPTYDNEYNYKESKHNYFLNKPIDLWKNNYYVYDIFKFIFSGTFLNLLDASLINKFKNNIIKKIKKNYHRIFCCYFQYMLHLFLVNYSYKYGCYIYNLDYANSEYRIYDYNKFFNIFNLKEFYQVDNKNIVIKNIKKFYEDISNFPNRDFFKKREFIINRINELNLLIFNKNIISLNEILEEINKITTNYNFSKIQNIEFKKIYIFLTIKDYKEILNLTSDKSKEIDIVTILDFYNFILSIKKKPMYFVISFLKSNFLLSENWNQLCDFDRDVYNQNNIQQYEDSKEEEFNSIYEKRILLIDSIKEILHKIEYLKKINIKNNKL